MRRIAALFLIGCSTGEAVVAEQPPSPTSNETTTAAPLDAAACRADHERRWPIALPSSCAGRRTCIDDRKRFWVDGRPFFPRGVYNGGFEYQRVLDNCPASGACRLTQPKDVNDYVRMLADAGFNLIQERSRNVPKLLDAN